MKETPAPPLHVDWEPNVGILEETLFVHVTSTTFLGATLIKAVMNVHMIDIATMKLGENVKWVPRELDGLYFIAHFAYGGAIIFLYQSTAIKQPLHNHPTNKTINVSITSAKYNLRQGQVS